MCVCVCLAIVRVFYILHHVRAVNITNSSGELVAYFFMIKKIVSQSLYGIKDNWKLLLVRNTANSWDLYL